MLKFKEVVKDKTEILVKQDQKTEIKLGAIKPHKGHALFELNLKTKDINKVEFKSVDYIMNGVNKVSKKVIEKKNCVYISALNQNNALKKFFKSIGK